MTVKTAGPNLGFKHKSCDELISERFYNQGQSWIWKAVLKSSGHRLRIHIKRNAYDFQSFAAVELWNGQKWNGVIRVPIEGLRCRSVSYVDRSPGVHLFQEDGGDLLVEALEVVL